MDLFLIRHLDGQENNFISIKLVHHFCQMTQAEENQYIWDPSAAKISSNVISLAINTGTGDKLPTDNLTNPISINIPAGIHFLKDHRTIFPIYHFKKYRNHYKFNTILFSVINRQTKQAKTNLAFTSDAETKQLLVYNMTMAKDDQIVKLLMSVESLKHIFLAIVTTNFVPTYADFNRSGNATVKLLVCIEDGQAVNETSSEKICDDPGRVGLANDSTSWGYLFNGQTISIIGRNVEEPAEDLLIHVGTLVLAHEEKITKHYVKQKSHGTKRSTAPRKSVCFKTSFNFRAHVRKTYSFLCLLFQNCVEFQNYVCPISKNIP